MFAQVDSSLGRSRGGLGIGLTLVRQLVHMHGGQITVASDGDGQGSEFTVELPLIAEPVHRSRAGDGIARYEGPPLNVLVADDNVDAAITLSALLRRMGQSVRVVHNGRQAIDAARDQCPQLAILDIGMPIVNGYEAAVAIREHCGPTRNLYLAALTGWGQDGDRQKAMESGFDTHLVKPIDAGNVSRLLSAAAEKVL
jgi:CheY-like chemotaxis protein